MSEKNWGGGRWWSGGMRSAVDCTVKRKPFTEIPTQIHTLKGIKDFPFLCLLSVSFC